MIVFVRHTKPPGLIDSTPGAEAFSMVGALVMTAAGHDIVAKYSIQDPSGDMAREIADFYSEWNGGHVPDTPLLDFHFSSVTTPRDLPGDARRARYIVDVDPPGLHLLFRSTNSSEYDLIFSSKVRIFDISTRTVIAEARCLVESDKDSDLHTRRELLDNGAATLKLLIVSKSEACVAHMENSLLAQRAAGKIR
jgi:hypothetical protein